MEGLDVIEEDRILVLDFYYRWNRSGGWEDPEYGHGRGLLKWSERKVLWS